jgi:hypothetical protein
MNTVACVSPFVPPEWIAAHGWQPRWLALDPARGRPGGGMRRGVCPYAGALVERAQSGLDAAAVVLTTACDQMRYAAAVMELGGCVPIFLFNLPGNSISTSCGGWAGSWWPWEANRRRPSGCGV